jgi:hypothetical protein
MRHPAQRRHRYQAKIDPPMAALKAITLMFPNSWFAKASIFFHAQNFAEWRHGRPKRKVDGT